MHVARELLKIEKADLVPFFYEDECFQVRLE